MLKVVQIIALIHIIFAVFVALFEIWGTDIIDVELFFQITITIIVLYAAIDIPLFYLRNNYEN